MTTFTFPWIARLSCDTVTHATGHKTSLHKTANTVSVETNEVWIRYDECNLPFWRWKVSSCSGQLRAVRCATPSCLCLVFARGRIDPAVRYNWRILPAVAHRYRSTSSGHVLTLLGYRLSPRYSYIATRTLISNHYQHTLLIS